jgi:hypothetical protein
LQGSTEQLLESDIPKVHVLKEPFKFFFDSDENTVQAWIDDMKRAHDESEEKIADRDMKWYWRKSGQPIPSSTIIISTEGNDMNHKDKTEIIVLPTAHYAKKGITDE